MGDAVDVEEGNDNGREKEITRQKTESGDASVSREQPAEPTDALKPSSQTSRTPRLPHANTFPSTPGMRIPLDELIGSFEESAKRVQLPQESPEERIGWIPNSSSTLLTPNRKRKRARSSSPSCPTTASQRQETSAIFTATAAQTEKKTPEADPAAALWKQYVTTREQDGDGEGKLPAFGQLVFERSPRPLETPAKGAGFRRWASTGNDWPASKTKKRRTATRTSINLWQDPHVVESAGRSKVSALVDKIQESLATQKLASSELKPAVLISAPSSSSPLPEPAGMEPETILPAWSPLQAKQLAPPPNTASVRPALNALMNGDGGVHHDAATEHDHQRPADVACDSFRPSKLHLQSKAPLPAYKRPSITRAPSNDGSKAGSRPTTALSVPAPPPVCAVDVDDFGEDFDLSAEDLDELMDGQPPLHQRPLHQIPAHPNPPPARHFDPSNNYQSATTGQANEPIVVNDDDEDDDEFACDDIDEASLAQAEFSATQAYRASHPQSHDPTLRSK